MASHIHSVQNERVKRAVRLRDRRGRQRQGRIIIDGCREVRRALQSGVHPLEAFISDVQLHDPEIEAIIELLQPHRIGPTLATAEVFQKLAFGNRTEGIVLVAREPQPSLQDLRLPDDALICVLEGVEKPGNLGGIVRTADAAGLAAVLMADGGTDIFNPNAIRASLGAIFRIPVCAASTADVIQWLRKNGFAIFAARVDGALDYANADYRGKSALVLGSEAEGLTAAWRGSDVADIVLPILGIVDSLNVSATAAVLFYEALRQRRTETMRPTE